MITSYLNNYLVKWILVSDGSAVNALSFEAYQTMRGSIVELKPIRNLITSFYEGTV